MSILSLEKLSAVIFEMWHVKQMNAANRQWFRETETHFNCNVSCHQATCYLDLFSMYSRTNVSIYMYICTQTLFQIWIDMGPDVQLPHGVANVI